MTWQDELRALDANLAAGNISAEEYRRIRDEVLAKSAMAFPEPGQQQQPPQQQPGTPPPGFQQPGTPPPGFQQPGTPPPGFQQPGPQQQGQTSFGAVPPWSAEATQSIQPVGRPYPNEKTQVVQGGDAERTQVVPGQGNQGAWPPAGGWQRGGQQQDSADSSPPWGRPGFEPVMPSPESWIRQGPEAFDSGFGARRGRVIGIVVAVVVVIGLAVGAVIFFTSKSGTTNQAGGTTTTTHAPATTTHTLPAPPPTKTPPADTAHALIDPPGVVRNGGGVLDLNTLQTDNLLPKAMVDALSQAGMSNGLLKTTTDNGVIVGLYAFTVSSQADATSVAHAYASLQTSGGVPTDAKHSLQGVPVFSTAPSATTSVARAVYVLYDRVIIVEALGNDYTSVQQTFTQVLHDQIALSPPTVRTS